MPADMPERRDATRRPGPRRFLPIALIACGAAAGLLFARDYLSFAALAEHYDALQAFRGAYPGLAAAAYMLAYVAVVAFSIPGAVWLTLAGGFLFGLTAGAAMTVIAATLGATLIFLAARTALGGRLRAHAGSWIDRLEGQFKEGEVSFLLVMRLVPAVPFFVANLAPAFLGARLRTFVWTTLLGIVPGTLVYISIGAGLGEELERGERPDLGVIFEPHVLGPLLGLAALAALPLVMRKLGLRRPG
jgi:uncharacterized membrane protein YdjX (TVP38/TMEM64 family)